MMLPAYNPLARLGAVIQYNADQPPDAATIAIIQARGDTVELVDRTAHNEEASFDYQSDPYLAGGGNPLYRDPANIPTPPRAQLLDCHPRNLECVAENQVKAATEQTLWAAYQQAQRGASDPTAPDRYVALLNTFQQTGSLPSSVMQASAAQPMGAPPAVAPPPATYTAPAAKTPASSTGTAKQPTIQPTVTTGAQPEIVTLTEEPKQTEIPTWALIAATGAAALLFLGGRRQ